MCLCLWEFIKSTVINIIIHYNTITIIVIIEADSLIQPATLLSLTFTFTKSGLDGYWDLDG